MGSFPTLFTKTVSGIDAESMFVAASFSAFRSIAEDTSPSWMTFTLEGFIDAFSMPAVGEGFTFGTIGAFPSRITDALVGFVATPVLTSVTFGNITKSTLPSVFADALRGFIVTGSVKTASHGDARVAPRSVPSDLAGADVRQDAFPVFTTLSVNIASRNFAKFFRTSPTGQANYIPFVVTNVF